MMASPTKSASPAQVDFEVMSAAPLVGSASVGRLMRVSDRLTNAVAALTTSNPTSHAATRNAAAAITSMALEASTDSSLSRLGASRHGGTIESRPPSRAQRRLSAYPPPYWT